MSDSRKRTQLCFDLNKLRLVAKFFQETIDKNENALYAEIWFDKALAYKIACRTLLSEANHSARNEQSFYAEAKLYALFCNGYVTPDRIERTQLTFAKVQGSFEKYSNCSLQIGYDAEEGPFIKGGYLQKGNPTLLFIISPKSYNEYQYRKGFGKICNYSPQSSQLSEKKKIIAELLKTGESGNSLSWPAFKTWEETYKPKMQEIKVEVEPSPYYYDPCM